MESSAPRAGGNRAGFQTSELRLNSRLLDANQSAPRTLGRQHHGAALTGLGARPIFEFIDEIAHHHPKIAEYIDHRLAIYAAADPRLLPASGADRFPPPLGRIVRNG
jgi:hypothetical protein